MFFLRKKKQPPHPAAPQVLTVSNSEEPQRESIHLPHYWSGPVGQARIDFCHDEIVAKVRDYILRAKDQEGRIKLIIPHAPGVYRMIGPTELAAVLVGTFDVYSGDGWDRFLGFVDGDSAIRLYRFLLNRADLLPPPAGSVMFSDAPSDELPVEMQSWWHGSKGLSRLFSLEL